MERLGFIHEKLDIKILILFILRRLPGIVAPIDLQDFTQQCDDGFGYFDYTDCLAELIESGLVIEEETGLSISKRGAAAVDEVQSSLPYSVRKKAEKIIGPEAERRRRLEMITAQHKLRDGGCFVTLAMSDGKCLAGESVRVPHGPKAGFGHGWRKRAGTSQEFVPAPLRATSGRSSPPPPCRLPGGGTLKARYARAFGGLTVFFRSRSIKYWDRA